MRTLSLAILMTLVACGGEVGGDLGGGPTGSDPTVTPTAGSDTDVPSRKKRPTGDGGASTTLPAAPERGMWVWESAVATDAVERTQLLDFANAHGVNRLYLQGQTLLSTQTNRAALATFLDAAAARGIGTELMFGDHSWALTANHASAVALAKAAVSFAAGASGARPVGVHFDVEPNTLDAWTTDMNGTANQYLDLLDELKAALAGSGLTLAVDFNFSYGHRDIVRNGATKALSHWIAKVVDRAAVMSYRDFALGSNGIVDISAESVGDFTYEGKPLVIGVNTLCNRPAGQTFCPDGMKVMETELASAATAEKGTSVAGFAIHDYANYEILKP